MKLASYSYEIKYRPGKQNLGSHTFFRAFCESLSESSTLKEIYENLRHSGITRLLHFVRTNNLPYSASDVKRVVSSCEVCAKMKSEFYFPKENTLIKATQPMERLSLDFKGPVSSVNSNNYLLIVVDELSRIPFAFV